VDALKVLKQDHQKVKTLFGEVEGLGDRASAQRKKLFQKIDQELTVHAKIEETIFYPEFRRHAQDGEERDEVLEAYEEHNVVDTLMGELSSLSVEDETWGAKAKVMQENLEHHIEEEETELFAKARQVFDEAELEDMGRRMAERKESAMAGVTRSDGR